MFDVQTGTPILRWKEQPVCLESLHECNILATLAVPYKVFYVRLRLIGGRGHSGVCVCFEPVEDTLRFILVNFTVEGGDKTVDISRLRFAKIY